MKRWALLTVLLYVLILSLLWAPLLLAAFGTEALEVVPEAVEGAIKGDVEAGYVWGGIGLWIGVMALAEAALLVVPVRLAAGRPVTKRWLVWPIIAGVFMLLLMVAGMYLCVGEHMGHTDWADEGLMFIAFCVVGGLWLIWAFFFGFYTGGRDAHTIISRMVKALLAGSILELLVAVPTHVVARYRNYCCAGFATFWGLAVGISVMLFAFGPGVFFLCVRRWAAIRPPGSKD